MNKFPVYSEAGNEYYVNIFDEYFKRGVVCDVYKPYQGRNFFGKRITKFKQVVDGAWDSGYYDEEEWNYDYIAIAKDAINEYEKKQAIKSAHENARNAGTKRFIEWDGR